ncbi:MAG: TonB-dependent receptor [Acidobacteria bacterium]|nr:TonB-dependent receptor [Acidobacteriota bacterium]MCB9399398.1 TonB-dependent receptor [Acidobacteriota bacterium]
MTNGPTQTQFRFQSRWVTQVGALVMFFFLSSAAFGQEVENDLLALKLEDLLNLEVVSATRGKAALREAPVPISVVLHKEIETSELWDLPTLLARLPEVDVLHISRSQPEVSLAGKGIVFNRRVLVLTDGRTEYNDVFGTTFWQALAVLNPEIKQVEVVRGPASSVFGANAFGGVINIITREPGSSEKQVQLSGGTANQREGAFVWDGTLQRHGLRISAGYNAADRLGDPVFFEGFNRFSTHNNVDESSDRLGITRWSVAWQMSPNPDWKLSAQWRQANGFLALLAQPGLPRAPWAIEQSGQLFKAQNQGWVPGSLSWTLYRNEFQYGTDLLPAAVQLEAFRPDLRNPDDRDGLYFFPSLVRPGHFEGVAKTWDSTLQWEGSPERSWSWVMGLEYRSIDHQGDFLPTSEPQALRGESLVANAHKSILSGFANVQGRSTEHKWLWNLGLRYDHDDQTESDWSYNASLQWTPQTDHRLQIIHRRAFRAPSIFELHAQLFLQVPHQNHAVRYEGNPQLENETISATDLIYDWWHGNQQWKIEVFREDYDKLIGNPDSGILDEIEFDPTTEQFTTTTTFQNLASAHMWGSQLTWRYKPNDACGLNSSLRYARPEQLNTLSGELFLTPRWKFNTAFTYQSPGRYECYLEALWIDRTRDSELEEESLSAAFSRENLGESTLLNASLMWVLQKQWRLRVQVWNLLDEDQPDYFEYDAVLSGVGEQRGRIWQAGIQWKM